MLNSRKRLLSVFPENDMDLALIGSAPARRKILVHFFMRPQYRGLVVPLDFNGIKVVDYGGEIAGRPSAYAK